MSKFEIPVEPLESWSEFTEFLAREVWKEAPPQRGQYLFRGQADADWHLISSFDRAISQSSSLNPDLEDRLLENFKKECESEPELKELTNDPDQLSALAQHSGVPTRLLDWTDSPYVAAFFAFQGHLEDAITADALSEYVAVWVLNKAAKIWQERRGVRVAAVQSWHNDRIRRQASYFTISKTPFMTLEEFVESFEETGNEVPLIKVTLPVSEAQMALGNLDLMGINHASLFGGRDGMAKAALIKTLLGRLATTS